MDCWLHQSWEEVGSKDALLALSLAVSDGFAKSRFHVYSMKKCAPVKPSTAIREQLFDLAEREP